MSAGETTPVIKALVQEEGSLLLDKILRVRITDRHQAMTKYKTKSGIYLFKTKKEITVYQCCQQKFKYQ